jgi:hypothetical protein
MAKKQTAKKTASAKRPATADPVDLPAAHDHAGGEDEHHHGYVLLHLSDTANGGPAKRDVTQADVRSEQVTRKISPWIDGLLLPVLVADAADRTMDAFHLALDRVAAQYLSLADAGGIKYFAFEHHF